MNPNLGYLFYRDYYKGYYQEKLYDKKPDEEDSAFEKRQQNYFKQKNDFLFENSVVATHYNQQGQNLSNQDFELLTTYPGLLVGSGYPFGLQANGEFKIGFSFDFTSGRPLIPGSSIKGVLRSAFPGFNEAERAANFDSNNFKEDDRLLLIEKLERAPFTWWCLFNEEKARLSSDDLNRIFEIEEAIFESHINGKPLSVYHRDIFYDVLLTESRNKNKRTLGSDFITPHYPNVLQEPTPIMFLKILPNVKLQFRFRLRDDASQAFAFSKAQKIAAFQRIIETLGIGAKTNVGYGHLIAESEWQKLQQPAIDIFKMPKASTSGFSPASAVPQFVTIKELSKLKENDFVDAAVSEIDAFDKTVTVTLLFSDGEMQSEKLKWPSFADLSVGEKVLVKVKAVRKLNGRPIKIEISSIRKMNM